MKQIGALLLVVVIGCGQSPKEAPVPKPAVSTEAKDSADVPQEPERRVVESRSPVPAAAADPVVGTWVGKWDDTWAVAFVVTRRGSVYDVVSKWEENSGSLMRRMVERAGRRGRQLGWQSASLEVDKDDADRASAVGSFQQLSETQQGRQTELLRTAQLIRVDGVTESELTVESINRLLAEHKQ